MSELSAATQLTPEQIRDALNARKHEGRDDWYYAERHCSFLSRNQSLGVAMLGSETATALVQGFEAQEELAALRAEIKWLHEHNEARNEFDRANLEQFNDLETRLKASLWECPDCAFSFSRVHVDSITEEFTCPCCSEAGLQTQVTRLTAERDSLQAALTLYVDRDMKEIARHTKDVRNSLDARSHGKIVETARGALAAPTEKK